MCGRRQRVKGFFWLSARGRVQVMCPAYVCGVYSPALLDLLVERKIAGRHQAPHRNEGRRGLSAY
jgi:hypothetical protein